MHGLRRILDNLGFHSISHFLSHVILQDGGSDIPIHPLYILFLLLFLLLLLKTIFSIIF